jgi:GT2 family glycosyltransferase
VVVASRHADAEIAHGARAGPRRSLGSTGVPLRLAVAQNVTAVPAFCLVIRKDVFQAAGGFGKDGAAGNYGDIGLCLRLLEMGYRNVWTPWAEIVMERAKNGAEKQVVTGHGFSRADPGAKQIRL